jgi:hypothetical protein
MSTNEFTYRTGTIKDQRELQELAIAAYSPFATLMTAENANKIKNHLL